MSVNLDKWQQAAVKTEKNKVLVVAAPGSGKTTVIINRVYYLMKYKKISGDNIIVITFTRAAAQNMKKRFQKLWGNDKSPFFGTFHALFYKILKRHVGDIKIIEPGITFNIINNTLLGYLDEVGEDKVKEVLNNISVFKCGGMDIEYFNPSIDKEVFIHCKNNYESYKRKNNLWDFDDIQIETKRLFNSNTALLDSYRRLFKHILVDEFQDCDTLQIEIIKMLSKENTLFAVGDEDQCIYTFRGSQPECMVEFQRHFNQGVKYFLNYNYRSTNNIVEGSKSLITNNKKRYEKDIKAYREDFGEIKVNYVLNEALQADAIASYIYKENCKGVNFSHHAVLFRTNQEARSLIDAFIRRKIPFIMLDKEYNFFEHFICKDILAYLKLSIDNKDRDSFIRIINKPFRYISKNSLLEVKNYTYYSDCFEILKSNKDMPAFQIKNLDNLQKDIAALNKTSLQSAINRIIMELEYLDYLKEYSVKYKVPFEDLQELLEDFIQSAEEYKSIVSFLAHVEVYTEEVKNNARKREGDSVIISTIHGVKGMEFNSVFIINCCEEFIPHRNSMDNNIEEERRLFYVGVTRAINKLNLYVPKNILGKNKEPSRFITESSFRGLAEEENAFKKDDYICHKAFNKGKILKIEDNVIEIRFLDGNCRKFDMDILVKNDLIKKI